MSYRCPWNRSLRCPIISKEIRLSVCPIQDSPFLDAISVWAWRNRTARSVELIPISKGTDNFDDWRQVKHAEMYRHFIDGSAVLDVLQDQTLMSSSVCEDMVQAKPKWLEIRFITRYNQEGK